MKALRSCSSPRTKPTPGACSGSKNRTPYVKDGINDYVVHGAKMRSIRSTPAPKQRRITSLRFAAGDGRRPAAPGRLGFQRQERLRQLRQDFRSSAKRSGRVLPHHHSTGPVIRRAERDAPGLRRHAVVQAVLSLRGQRLAGRRSRQSSPPPERTQGTQPRVDPSLQRGRYFHARQVGISVVRRVGPGVSLHSARAGGFRLRQRAAHADAARVVHASQRTDSRV